MLGPGAVRSGCAAPARRHGISTESASCGARNAASRRPGGCAVRSRQPSPAALCDPAPYCSSVSWRSHRKLTIDRSQCWSMVNVQRPACKCLSQYGASRRGAFHRWGRAPPFLSRSDLLVSSPGLINPWFARLGRPGCCTGRETQISEYWSEIPRNTGSQTPSRTWYWQANLERNPGSQTRTP